MTTRSALRAAACVAASLLLFSLAHLGVQNCDDAAMLAYAGALWDRRTLAIPHMEWLDERVDIGRRGRDGQLYSKYGLGQPAAAALMYGADVLSRPGGPPLIWAGYPIADSLAGGSLAQYTNVVLGALVVGVVVYAASEWHGSDVAWLAASALAAASPFWLAARGFGSEVGCSLGLLLATIAAERAVQRGSTLGLCASVAALGLAALFRPSALAYGAALLVWLWGRPTKTWVAAGAAFAAVVAALSAYNWVRYGSLLASGYGDGGSGFVPQLVGLAGYLVAPGRALAVFAPWTVLLVPWGLRALRNRSRLEMGILAGLVGFLAVHGAWREWEGGWAYGPRLLVPLLPVIALAIARDLASHAVLAGVLCAAGYALQVPTLAADPIVTHEIALNAGTMFRQLVWSVDRSIVAWQIRAAVDAGLHRWASGPGTAALVGFGCLAASWLRSSVLRRRREPVSAAVSG